MSSTFGILETSRSGLTAAQLGLNITSQNTANADTEGYTRQTLDVSARSPGTGSYRYASSEKVGQGVSVDSVYQIRNSFLDSRYRTENSTSNLYSSMESQLTPIESQFNEISDSTTTTNKLTGLSGMLDGIVTSLQEYQTNPTSTTISADVRSKVDYLASSIRSDASFLQDTLDSENKELGIYVSGGAGDTSNGNNTGGINGMIENIQSLNKEIVGYEVTGQKANDLRDSRNLLLDKLSSYIDISTTEQTNGSVTIQLRADKDSDSTSSGQYIINSGNDANEFQIDTSDGTKFEWGDSLSAAGTRVKGASSTIADVQGGIVKAYLNVINGDGSGDTEDPATGLCTNVGIPYLQKKLDDFATGFYNIMNNKNSGLLQYSAPASTTAPTDSAATIEVSDNWSKDADYFTNDISDANKGTYYSSCINALNSASASITLSSASGGTYTGSLSGFADSFTQEISSAVSVVKDKATSSKTTTDNLDSQRKSVSSVSADDEGVNLIKYQQAYNANARVITAIDEMLDKLINGTGKVGLS